MRSITDLLNFKYILGNRQLWLYLYIFIYLIYSLTSEYKDPLLALSIAVFTVAPITAAFLMFTFYILWEYVTTFSFGVTGVLLMQIIMVAKILWDNKSFAMNKKGLKAKCTSLQVVLLVYISIMGLASFFAGSGMTGIGFVFKVLVTFYAISFLYSDESYENLLKAILHILMISSIIATIYGIFHDTAIERWVSEMGTTVSQLYGTLGTTRMAFFYLISLTFFLYYVKNTLVRYAGIALFTTFILLTVSLTALVLYFIIILIYMYSLGKLSRTLIYCVLLMTAVLTTFPLWSRLKIVQPVLFRITYSIDAIEQGDFDNATTGRDELTSFYMKKLETASPATVLFGNAKTAMSATGFEINSHNTYIDMLFFFGFLGVVLLAVYQFRKLTLVRRKQFFYPYFTLKVIILLGASSVSILPATYFFFIIFI